MERGASSRCVTFVLFFRGAHFNAEDDAIYWIEISSIKSVSIMYMFYCYSV